MKVLFRAKLKALTKGDEARRTSNGKKPLLLLGLKGQGEEMALLQLSESNTMKEVKQLLRSSGYKETQLLSELWRSGKEQGRNIPNSVSSAL